MQHPFTPHLARYGVAILDGGLATQLEAQGATIDDDLWSARLLRDDASAIQRAHATYFAAGADAGISASYQATFEGFKRRGIEHDEATFLLTKSVELVALARGASTRATTSAAATAWPSRRRTSWTTPSNGAVSSSRSRATRTSSTARSCTSTAARTPARSHTTIK